MQIRTRMCTSADGYVTTPDGWPAQIADPAWSPEAYGFVEFQAQCDAVLMGRTTFEPALDADTWPWGDLDVFVLGSRRPPGTPDHVVVDDDPARLLEQVRAANRGGDVHLVGGPRTIETFRRLGALDELGLIVLPLLLGSGLQLTPFVSRDAGLTLKEAHALPNGAVEIRYACARNEHG
jgi:dihydrofolate reductase